MRRLSPRRSDRLIFMLLCLLPFFGVGLAACAAGQPPTKLPVAPQTGRRVALVVGCNYSGMQQLQTPQNDARAVAKTLQSIGWDVELATETDPQALRAALKRLSGKLTKNSVGLFYFSGKAVSREGVAYIVPVLSQAASQDENTVLVSCIAETEIVRAMASAQSRVVILNGGRPAFDRKRTVLEGISLAPAMPPNTLVAYDSKAGQDSYEMGNQPLGPYARRLVESLEKNKASFIQVFGEVGPLVSADVKNVNGIQHPEFRHTFQTDFVVAASTKPAPVKPPVFVQNDPKPVPVRPAPVVVAPPPVVPQPKPVAATHETGEKWALLIGVEQYQSDDIRSLNFTLRDVAALQKTLPLTGFVPDHILAMTSDLPSKNLNYPTNTNILKRLKTLKKQLNPDDTLLIYFSGHGFQEQEGGQNFLGSVNADVTDSALLKKTTVSIEELREALNGLQASQLILIMDCCRNNPFKKDGSKGGTDANTRTSSFSRDLSLVSDTVGKKIGTAILFACQEGQRSWEDPDAQQGAFTLFLLEALQGKATRDGTLTVTDLAGYVEKRMKAWCIKTGKDQSPDYEQHNRARIVIQEGTSTPQP